MNKTTLIAVGAAVLLAANARPRMPAAVVAHVDLERVFNECVWLDDAESQLTQAAENYQKELDRLRTEVDLARQDIELLIPGTDQYKKAEKAYVHAAVGFQAYVEFSRGRLEKLRVSSRVAIYERIRKAAEAYAVANDVSYIITNDSAATLQEGNDVQVVQQLLLRRVIYATTEFDVTDPLIDWINKK